MRPIRNGRRASPRPPSIRSISTTGRRRRTASARRPQGGVELAVSLDRGTFMRDGDVLLWDAAAARAVVARISLRDVMIIHLDGLAGGRARARHAHLRRARPRARQPALAGARQGRPRLRAAHGRPQGDGVGHEDASLREHPLRVRAGRRDRPVPGAARVAPALRRRRRAGAHAHAGGVRRGRRRDRRDLRPPSGERARDPRSQPFARHTHAHSHDRTHAHARTPHASPRSATDAGPDSSPRRK